MNQDSEITLIKRAALLVLSQAQRDGATDLVMAPATTGGTSIRYKIAAVWHDYAVSPWFRPYPIPFPRERRHASSALEGVTGG